MPANEVLAIGMFLSFILLVFTGFPVAWILGGLAVIFSALSLILEADFSIQTGLDWNYTSLSVERICDVMGNWVMVALPMFIMMGLLLDRSGIANDLMRNFSKLFGGIHGGLAISVALIGLLLAASTGIIGASVVLLALLGLPVMLKEGYDQSFASGTICAVGTLGILIPPSIMLVLMADRMAMSVGDLFLGAVFPGLVLTSLYIIYIILFAFGSIIGMGILSAVIAWPIMASARKGIDLFKKFNLLIGGITALIGSVVISHSFQHLTVFITKF